MMDLPASPGSLRLTPNDVQDMIRGIKGVKDILPEETPRWRLIEEAARRWASRFGFREIRIPIFETTMLFARSIGATTDIVEKEMYTFPDRDGSSLTLRPEGTAGTVRAFIEHNRAADPVPQKYFYLGPMFRHERPQAGRLRQFHQFGVESFGTPDPSADIEVISLLWRFLSELGLPGLTLELNSLGRAEDRARYIPNLVTFLKEHAARLCGNCQRRIDMNPLRVLDCKVPECRRVTESAPHLMDYLSSDAREHFDRVLAGLQTLAIPYTLNPRLVRGLDYYCLTAFELTCSHLGAQNAVGAGGRYDTLVETLGGPPTPAVGFAAGLERISLMLPEGSLPPPIPRIYVAAFGARGSTEGLKLLDVLRQSGVPAETDFRSTTLKAHLRQADRLGCLYSILLGDEEVATGTVIVRNMTTKAQEPVLLKSVATHLSERLQSSS